MSLDALRGFDMFWIVGGQQIVHALRQVSQTGFVGFLSEQMDHKPWAGVTFYDLIFPLFIFIVGASLVFSLGRTMQQSGKAAACRRIIIRSALLYLIGIFYSHGLADGWEKVRLVGILQRIAFCYLFTGLIFCSFKLRGMIVICASLILSYWALMTFVPIRDISLKRASLVRLAAETGTTDRAALFLSATNRVAGRFEDGLNLAHHFDFQYLPGSKRGRPYYPEGLLSTLPSIATCLLGVFAGLLLQSKTVPDQKKVALLIAAGVAGVALGFLWGLQFPVIKKIWSSSFVLVAGGYSCLFLAAFYQLIEIWHWRQWAQPFVWIGMNPITIYLAHNIVDFPDLADRLVGGPVQAALGVYGGLLNTAVVMGMSFLLAYFLFRKKIFLRV